MREREEQARFDPAWRPPAEGYCYRHGNDWSQCAGDHMLYPKRSSQEILTRDPICLHEPFCWKQLDWRHSDPSDHAALRGWSCPHNAARLIDLTRHRAGMADQSAFVEKTLSAMSGAHTQHSVTLCYSGSTASRNCRYTCPVYGVSFKTCKDPPQLRALRERCEHCSGIVESNARDYFARYRHNKEFLEADALMFSFWPSEFELWMAWNKTLVVNPCHRINMYRCSEATSRRNFENVRRLAMSGPAGVFPRAPQHVLASSNVYDGEYMRHYTGVNPILLGCGLEDAIGPNISWVGSRREILWNSYHPLPPELRELLPGSQAPWDGKSFDFVKQLADGLRFPHASSSVRLKMADLAEFKAVVALPYSITNFKVVEQYAMNMPLFVPSPALGASFVVDRTAVHGPCCPGMNETEMPAPHTSSPYEFSPNVRPDFDGPSAAAAATFWVGFPEIYLWPCVKQFHSWRELITQLETADLDEMSKCMAQAQKWRRFERAQNWCWAMGRITGSIMPRATSNADAEDYDYLYSQGYEKALRDLYNTTEILERTEWCDLDSCMDGTQPID